MHRVVDVMMANNDFEFIGQALDSLAPIDTIQVADTRMKLILWRWIYREQWTKDKTLAMEGGKGGSGDETTAKWNEMKWKVQWFKVRSKTDLEPA